MKARMNLKGITTHLIGFSWIIYWSVTTLFFVSGCEDFVKIGPPRSEIVSERVFTEDATAISAMRGIYTLMVSQDFASGDGNSMTYLAGLSADELINFTTLDQDQMDFYANSLKSTNSTIYSSFWSRLYKCISNANNLIKGLDNSSGVAGTTKKQLLGEALFVRAFCHFYLLNLFGEIPISTSVDFEVNRLAFRSPATLVYQQIVDDLIEAQSLLSIGYDYSNGERIQPNRFAANALLARVYLYMGRWSDAEDQASAVINSASLYSLKSNLNDVFLKNSTEAIWQLQPVQPGKNTKEAEILIFTSTPPPNAALNIDLVNVFESGDSRRSNWIGSVTNGSSTWYYPFKYKKFGAPVVEYSMVLRLAEQYLIRSEARAYLNNISGSQDDLNVIRSRAGLPNTSANSRESLLSAIERERRVELFVEWGHRWLDLKRTEKMNAVLSQLKLDWQPTDALYPIPELELSKDPNLTQNAGY